MSCSSDLRRRVPAMAAADRGRERDRRGGGRPQAPRLQCRDPRGSRRRAAARRRQELHRPVRLPTRQPTSAVLLGSRAHPQPTRLHRARQCAEPGARRARLPLDGDPDARGHDLGAADRGQACPVRLRQLLRCHVVRDQGLARSDRRLRPQQLEPSRPPVHHRGRCRAGSSGAQHLYAAVHPGDRRRCRFHARRLRHRERARRLPEPARAGLRHRPDPAIRQDPRSRSR